jgi:hypothetical protein
MKLLQELIIINEEQKADTKTVSRDAAAKVYHRDYQKTKKKKYRKYDPAEDNK